MNPFNTPRDLNWLVMTLTHCSHSLKNNTFWKELPLIFLICSLVLLFCLFMQPCNQVSLVKLTKFKIEIIRKYEHFIIREKIWILLFVITKPSGRNYHLMAPICTCILLFYLSICNLVTNFDKHFMINGRKDLNFTIVFGIITTLGFIKKYIWEKTLAYK